MRILRATWLVGSLLVSLLISSSVIAIDEKALLREKLAEGTLVYARVPGLWSAGTPGKNSLEKAMASKANVQAIEALREDFSTKLGMSLKDKERLLVELFANKLHAPLELALQTLPESGPMPVLLLSTSLDFNKTGLSTYLKNLATEFPALSLIQDIDADGNGLMQLSNFKLAFSFDEKSKRFNGFAGVNASASLLKNYFTSTRTPAAHAMLDDEAQVDADHQGFFVWLDAAKILAFANATGALASNPQWQKMKSAGVDKLKELSLGKGVANGKGRLIMRGQFSEPVAWLYEAKNQLTLQTVGKPEILFTSSLPDIDKYNQWIGFLRPQTRINYDQNIKKIEKDMGFTFSDLLSALGPEMNWFRDEAGSYWGIRIRDKKAFASLKKKVSRSKNLDYTSKKIGGMTVEHIALPDFVDKSDFEKGKNKDNPFLAFYTSLKNHVFWVQEGDYLLLGSVPQSLLDRAAGTKTSTLNKWLTQQQGQDFSKSLIGISVDSSIRPADVYYAYLSVLFAIADYSGTQLDYFSFPPASSLTLSDDASLGLQLDLNENAFSLGLSYEYSTAEVLFGNSMAGVATIGILAAVALPAYQDYQLRAKTSVALQNVNSLQREIETWSKSHAGKYPTSEQINLSSYTFINPIDSVYLDENKKSILISLTGDKNLEGKFISLKLEQETPPHWTCITNVDKKYMPSTCR